MTKRIPKVGDVYKCVSTDWEAKVGEIVTITKVDDGEFYTGAYYSAEKGEGFWVITTYPNDFEFVSSEQH